MIFMDSEVTLQNLCITVIADKFDRFYVLSNTDDAHLQRMFQFLQRVYSFEIVEELDWIGDLQEKYIGLLVNKYTTVVRANWFKDVPWEVVTAKFAEVGSNIQKMYFYEFEEEKPWQNITHYLINVEVMIFCCGCNDEDLKFIAHFCPNIIEIHATDCHVTNAGLKYLCMKENGKPLCPKLKKVLTANSDVDDEGVQYLLENLPSLEKTDYRGLPRVILYSQSEKFGKVETYNLTSLNLLPFQHNETNFRICLTLCPRLKSLSCSIRKEEELNFFPNHLKNLKLNCFLKSKINIYTFLLIKGRKLTFLSLSGCFLSVGTLAESCPCLQTLILQKVSFKNDNFTSVFHQLETCIFVDTTTEPTTTKSICLLLTSSPKLKYITFQKCDLSSRDLHEILISCKSFPIKKVIFKASTVDMKFAYKFLKHCHIYWFELHNCDVSKKDAVKFIRFARSLPRNRIVDSRLLYDIDEEDKVDFVAFLDYDILIFSFIKHVEYGGY